MLGALAALCAFAAVACGQTSQDSGDATGGRVKYTVHFDVNTDYQTNAVLDQLVKENMHAKKPTVEITQDGVSDYIVFGWYTEKDCVNEWNFRKNKITENITLYAKWGYEYTVNYYVVDDSVEADAALSPVKTEKVRDGKLVKELPEYVVGFEYYGSYTDRACTQAFDYTRAVTASTDIYMKKSASISLSEGNRSGALSENLTAVAAGSDPENGLIAKAGWAEPKKVGDEVYTYVNFGYSPYNPDPYVEWTQPIDIRNTQTLTFTFKNLGSSDTFSVYFTTFADEKQTEYSATGKYYTASFVQQLKLQASQRTMNETDDNWITVTFDMTEIYANGYSVWGTSSYLAGLRIQSTYKSKSEKDASNAYLIKSIVGGKQDVTVEDSETVQKIRANDDEATVAAKAEAQESVRGFVFPKDFAKATVENGSVYNREAGLLLYAENEIALRGSEDKKTLLQLAYSGDTVDLKEYCTLNLRLRNYGYNGEINVTLYNDENVSVSVTMAMESRMQGVQEYFVNLSSNRFMEGALQKVVLEYTSLGTDNAILIESVYFSEFRADDIAGVNFNDRFTVGFTTTDKTEVAYDANLKATVFTVSGDEELFSAKECAFTNDGYAAATLQYYVTEATEITAVKIGYKIDGTYKYYEYPVDAQTVNQKQKTATVVFKAEERGCITGLSVSFTGTGKIAVAALTFDLSAENAVDFTNSYSNFYTLYDWAANCTYVYDSAAKAAKITPDAGETAHFRAYIGYVANELKSSTWNPSKNIDLRGKTTIKIVYRNPSENDKFALAIGLDQTDYGTGESEEHPFSDATLQTNMDSGEWSVLSFELPSKYTAEDAGYMLAKLSMQFSGTLYLRAIVVE